MVALTAMAASALPSQPAHLQYRATQVSSRVQGSSGCLLLQSNNSLTTCTVRRQLGVRFQPA